TVFHPRNIPLLPQGTGRQAVLEFFATASDIKLVRFIESRLHSALMQRQLGADEMVWTRGMFAILDLDPEKDKPSLSLLRSMQHPEDRLTFEQADANIRAAKPFSRRYRVIRRDGTMRILSQHIEILFDADGNPDWSIGVVCDVTEQANLEERETLLERRFEAATRDSGLILNSLRPDGFVIQIVGSSPVHEAELNRRYGFLWHELIHPDDRAETFAVFEKAVREKTGVSREHRIRQRDGNYRWRRSIWTPLFDNQHRLVEFMSVSMDIENEKTIRSSSDVDIPISGAQIRAARALVRWSVQQLADAACVSPSVIRRIEEYDGETAGVADSLMLIRDTLVKAGVEFIFPATGKPGVRLI
ncbi:MAG: PAS domain-containing protein, partial [Thermomicrobiales bacterium]